MNKIDLNSIPRGSFTDSATSPGGITCRQFMECVLEHKANSLPDHCKVQVETHLHACDDCWAGRAILLTEYELAVQESNIPILLRLQQENPKAYEAVVQAREALRQKRVQEGSPLPGDDPEYDARLHEAALRGIELARQARQQPKKPPPTT